MRTPSIRVAVAVAATAISVSGLAACSSAHPASSASTPPRAVATGARHTTLHFVATEEPGNMALEDLGAKSAPGGPDIGDLLAFTQAVTRDGTPAGQVHVVAVGVDHQRHLSEATATIVLRDGTIQLAGIVSTNPRFTLTVTGGTGAYTGDTGTLAFDASGKTQTMTVRLTSQPRLS